MNKFLLSLGNNNDNIEIEFDIFETDIAKKWATEISKNYPLYEIDRFQGWPNDGKDLNYYLKEIKDQIDTVNDYQPNTIVDNFKSNNLHKNNDKFNFLHKFFEDLRGPEDLGTPFYNNSPQNVKDAINRFNILIHECEHILNEFSYPNIIGTYKDRVRYELSEKDYEHFTFQWKFGHVYINYCETGKPLLDVFKDQDTFIGKENVRPLKYYSADWMIKFDPGTSDEIVNFRLEKFYQWYNSTDYEFDHLSLGLIPVAKISNPDTSIINKISNYKRINSTCIK